MLWIMAMATNSHNIRRNFLTNANSRLPDAADSAVDTESTAVSTRISCMSTPRVERQRTKTSLLLGSSPLSPVFNNLTPVHPDLPVGKAVYKRPVVAYNSHAYTLLLQVP